MQLAYTGHSHVGATVDGHGPSETTATPLCFAMHGFWYVVSSSPQTTSDAELAAQLSVMAYTRLVVWFNWIFAMPALGALVLIGSLRTFWLAILAHPEPIDYSSPDQINSIHLSNMIWLLFGMQTPLNAECYGLYFRTIYCLIIYIPGHGPCETTVFPFDSAAHEFAYVLPSFPHTGVFWHAIRRTCVGLRVCIWLLDM